MKAAGRYRRQLYAYVDERTDATEQAVCDASMAMMDTLDALLLAERGR